MTISHVAQLTKSERAHLVAAAQHSGEMEGLHVDQAWERDASEYVDGTISSSELVSRTRARYGLE